ncbi:MAG: glutamine--fructose-6-phosphate transaminase (isomerizing), partial [Candidatus Binataceae bacterium]
MCGIIGYVGPSEAVPILLGALARLEYRGYDAAGVATINGAGMEIRRAVGKRENLRRALEGSPLKGSIGIGHTRWATHGRPSEGNAHPHKAGPVAVIHNGIVENYVELRAALTGRGHKLSSETDTELISHLIEERVRAGLGLTEAVRQTVLELRGSFSIVVLSETEPDKLVAAKTATPLVLGLGDGENFVASDIPAILGHTRRTIVLEDGELAELGAHGVRLMTFDGVAIERAPRLIEWDSVAATEGGFQHYLRKEIAEQPQAWIDTMAGRADGASSTVRFEGEQLPAGGPAAIGRIVMLGAGASWITALVGK